jgi:tight adherence protein B
MLGLLLAVFIGVFGVAVLLLAASGVGASERMKQTRERLDAALAANIVKNRDELVNIRKDELLSAIPLLNRILLQVQVAPRLSRLLYQASVPWTPGGVMLMALMTWVVCAWLVYLRTGIATFSLVLGLVPAGWPFAYVLYKRGKRFDKFEEGLPAALDLMVSGLRAGQSLFSAMDLVARETGGPIGKEFRICCDEQNYGLELRTAMENTAARVPIQDVRVIMTAILIQKESGGNLAEVLDKCAHVIRERFRLKREIKTRTAQGRLTGWILSFLPVVLGLLLFIVNPDGIKLLWERPMGLKMMYGAAVMTLTGGLVIRKIISSIKV